MSLYSDCSRINLGKLANISVDRRVEYTNEADIMQLFGSSDPSELPARIKCISYPGESRGQSAEICIVSFADMLRGKTAKPADECAKLPNKYIIFTDTIVLMPNDAEKNIVSAGASANNSAQLRWICEYIVVNEHKIIPGIYSALAESINIARLADSATPDSTESRLCELFANISLPDLSADDIAMILDSARQAEDKLCVATSVYHSELARISGISDEAARDHLARTRTDEFNHLSEQYCGIIYDLFADDCKFV